MRSEIRAAAATLAALVLVAASASIAAADEVEAPTPEVVATIAAPASEPTATEQDDATTSAGSATDTANTTASEESEGTDGTDGENTPTKPELPEGATAIEDAQLRWGLNAESNRAAFAPGTFNFLSAGKIKNPGQGGRSISLKTMDWGTTSTSPAEPSGWSASSGSVRLEKYSADSKSYQPATPAGLGTDSEGAKLATSSSTNSNHQVVIDGGSGSVDPELKSAEVQWKGSFTVLYYSGMTFFYVTDPKLTVTKGVGRLTATLSGFGSSMEDQSKWDEIEPVENVVLADLGTVDLSSEKGFTVTPKYKTVKVSVPSGQVAQVRTGKTWGSFPQSFVNYQISSGSGPYWYSSGGSADPHKVASPLSVSYDADLPVKVTPPPTTNTSDSVTNDTIAPPTIVTNSAPAAGFAPPPVNAAPTSTEVLASADLTQVRPVSTVLGATAPTTAGRDTTALWIAGTVLLVLAALVAASPFAYAATVRRR